MPAPESLFNKVSDLQPVVLSKKRSRHKCFPVNFVKLFRHVFLSTALDDCFWKNTGDFTKNGANSYCY